MKLVLHLWLRNHPWSNRTGLGLALEVLVDFSREEPACGELPLAPRAVRWPVRFEDHAPTLLRRLSEGFGSCEGSGRPEGVAIQRRGCLVPAVVEHPLVCSSACADGDAPSSHDVVWDNRF